jgi:hypothetical protein
MMPTVELKAPPGQFRVVAVDTFDGTDWVHGDFATAEEALRAARSKGGEMLKTQQMQVIEGTRTAGLSRRGSTAWLSRIRRASSSTTWLPCRSSTSTSRSCPTAIGAWARLSAR